MVLSELLAGIYNGKVMENFSQMEIGSVVSDSRTADKESVFVALKGPDHNGEEYIDDAIKKGARVVVAENIISEHTDNDHVCFLRVDNAKKFLEDTLLKFYGDLSDKVKIIGITGTNGKTTISYILEHILRSSGRKCGLIGTITHKVNDVCIKANNTTPGLVENYRLINDMAVSGADYCIMEASSHGLKQGRVSGIRFNTAIFSNLTSEHLDYHKTMKDYFESKSILFKKLDSIGKAIINIDDEYGRKLKNMELPAVISYGIENSADIKADNIKYYINGTEFDIVSSDNKFKVKTCLIGKHNVYNILAAVAACISEGIDINYIKKSMKSMPTVEGRLDLVANSRGLNILIDYAHTHDALENVLSAIRGVSSSRIILVFGCGGDRDRAKRPKMAEVASRDADVVIVTNDNPRTEDPKKIIEDIISGLNGKEHKVIENRKDAIKYALNIAEKDDIVLLAGKGHEKYQILKDGTIEFDEKKIVQEILNK